MPVFESVATISFAYPEWYGEYFEALVDEFHESHPNIDVELRPIPNTVFTQSFWAGDADAFVSGAWSTNLRMMLEQELIQDVRPLLETDIDFDRGDFYMRDTGFLSNEQRILGVPLGTYLTVMYYNQDLFDRYGAPYPTSEWTWADFLEAGRILRDPDADVFGYMATGTSGAANFVYQHGGQLYDNLQSPTYATFNVPSTLETLEWYTALFLDHDIAPTAEQARQAFGGYDAVYWAIRGGHVGMWMGGLWEQGNLEDDDGPLFHWGMVPLPHKTQAASLGMGEYLFIFKDAQNPEACWQWLSFVSNRMAPSWLVPVRKSQVESEAYAQLVGDEVATVVRAAVPNVLIVAPKVFGELDIFGRAAERVINGMDMPSEALEWAQQEAEKALP
jgi:multiple sugar transport system substrate-binding protein